MCAVDGGYAGRDVMSNGVVTGIREDNMFCMYTVCFMKVGGESDYY